MPTATGAYATTALVKERADPSSQYTWAAAEDTLLGKLCDETNQWIETFTGRVLAPVTYTNALFDGNGRRSMTIRAGVRSVTTLELAPYTGATFATVTAADILLRPVEHERDPGWPPTILMLSDVPTGSHVYFPRGYGNVRLNGTGGWTAIPDDVRMVAVTIAERAWLASKAGRADEVQTIEADGSVTITRFITAEDRRTLGRYAIGAPVG